MRVSARGKKKKEGGRGEQANLATKYIKLERENYSKWDKVDLMCKPVAHSVETLRRKWDKVNSKIHKITAKKLLG